MRTLSTSLVFLIALACAAPVLAGQDPGTRYIHLRHQLGCNRSLTYSRIQLDPQDYAGRVIELRGTLNGKVQTAGGGESIMLVLSDGSGVMLTGVSSGMLSGVAGYSAPMVRVLARVGSGELGNVPPLKVLAVVHDSIVTAAERQMTARAQAANQQLRSAEMQRAGFRNALRRGMPDGGQLASRGGFARLSPATAEQAMANLGPRVSGIFPAYYTFIARQNPRLNEQQAVSIAFNLLRFSDQYNVDPRLVVAMIICESNFNPQAVSRTGAVGLGQLMPGTAKELGLSNPFDPVQNLEGSISYLSSRLATFGGLQNAYLAIAAYNAGVGAVKKYAGVPPYRETQNYVKRVIGIYNTLCGGRP